MPKKIEAIDVPAFIRSSLVAVLYAGTSPPLTEQVFKAFEAQGAATGRVDTGGFMFSTMWSWVHERQRALGWAAADSIPTGYYLFVDGEIGAFHPGLVDFQNDKPFNKDPIESARANAMFAQINAAHDLILMHRGWR